MPQRLDPYSEGFLRTCYAHDVPEPIAHQMLVKAATSNARQPGVQLPIGVIGQLALFEAGKRVSELARGTA